MKNDILITVIMTVVCVGGMYIYGYIDDYYKRKKESKENE